MTSATDREPDAGWVVVVPVKRLDVAKSRLSTRTASQRRALALAFALDVVAAARATPGVHDVVVVTDEPEAAAAARDLGALVVGDRPDAGLNPALSFGAEQARARHPEAGVVVVASDLPALRARELGDVLAAAARYEGRSFVSDGGGTGTTVLAAAPGVALDPCFGPRSRAAHAASGARELRLAVPGLRRDVDTEVDLWDAVRLGVGPRTAAVLGS